LRLIADVSGRESGEHAGMTLIWFVIWFVADHLGDAASLDASPANIWTTTLLLAVALDLARQHGSSMARKRPSERT
jgi:hypothetical protein